MNWNKFLESKSISQEDFEKKSPSEMAQLTAEFQGEKVKELQNELQNTATKEDLDSVNKKIEEFISSAELNKEVVLEIKKSVELQGEALTKMQEKSEKGANTEIEKSISEQIKEAFASKADEFEALKSQKGASMNITVKVPATILTSTNLTPAGNRIARTETEAGRVGFVRRNPFMLDLVSTGRTNSKVVYWVELVNEDGTIAMTAEGDAKAQIDYDYVENSAQVRKATGYMKASKEMMDDVDGFVADVEAELVERIRLFVDDQILNGDGTGENLVGVSANATAFAAGTTLASSIDNAQESDVLRAAIAQVYRNEFQATACVVHPDMLAKMDLLKATDNQYIIPPFKSADGMVVSGVPVVSNTNIGADDFYVGDFTKYKVKIREDIDIQFGYENDDWTKNLVTPLAEMRLVGYIPANHYGAIVTGTFTAAKAALETP